MAAGQNQLITTPRREIDYGKLGALVGQAMNPTQGLYQQLLPQLLLKQYESKLALRQAQEQLKNNISLLGGVGTQGGQRVKGGSIDLSTGKISMNFEKPTPEDLLKQKQAQEDYNFLYGQGQENVTSTNIPNVVSGIRQQGSSVATQSPTPETVVSGQSIPQFILDLPPSKRPQAIADYQKEQAKGLPAESAGKLTMIQQAERDLDEAEKLLFKDGKFLRGRAAGANVPLGRAFGIGRVIPNVGFGAANRMLASYMDNALEAKLRIETGAAATQEEFDRIRDRFGITFFDSAESARSKLKRLREFMKNASISIDPTGKFVYKTGDKKLDNELNLEPLKINSVKKVGE